MRELLQQASIHIRAWHKKYGEFQPQWLPPAKDVELLEAIDEALSRSRWVPVAERLPVVPEGRRDVCIWVYGGQFKSPSWVYWCLGVSEQLTRHFTHWMYRQDDTPAPPRSES